MKSNYWVTILFPLLSTTTKMTTTTTHAFQQCALTFITRSFTHEPQCHYMNSYSNNKKQSLKRRNIRLQITSSDTPALSPDPPPHNATRTTNSKTVFDLTTALFCAGLAFDAYAEPNANSPRWERGSKGTNVAFQSASFTRSLYRGIVEVTPKNVTDLPDESDNVEGVLSGSGVDPYVLVAVVEGEWKEDIQKLSDRFSSGVQELQGSAHVGRGRTAWSNVNENQARSNVKKNRGAAYSKPGGNYSTGYYIPSTWGRGGQAIWLEEPPLYLYVREPEKARMVFTVMDEDVVAEDDVIGSVSMKLTELFPTAARSKSNVDVVETAKKLVMEKLKQQKQKGDNKSPIDLSNIQVSNEDILKSIMQQWEGELPLKTKPKKKDKKGQVVLGAAAGALVAGPAGAAVGGFLGSLLEDNVRGKLGVRLRFLPIPSRASKRERYEVRRLFSHISHVSMN